MAIDRTLYPYVVRVETPSQPMLINVSMNARPSYIDEHGAIRVGFDNKDTADAFMLNYGGTYDSKFTHGTTKLVTQDYDVPE